MKTDLKQQNLNAEVSHTLADDERIANISEAIRKEEAILQDRLPFLRHQNSIGLAILLLSVAGMIGSAYLYYHAHISALVCILVSAFFASLSHELEHDLIHRLYFRKNKFIQNLMMMIVWLMRPNTVNPWYRRRLHFLHHKVSGTPQDVEERIIGNGIKRGVSRFIVMFDSLMGLFIKASELKQAKEFSLAKVLSSSMPLSLIHYGVWYVFLFFHLFSFIYQAMGYQLTLPELMSTAISVINFLVVVLVAPNVLRSGCLNFISSNMHYYGNVDGLLQQCQVLRGKRFLPFHLFCFNFGGTHAIHHFVVGQPFYIRQMIASKVYPVMADNGVRFNDFSTFMNTNRYLPQA